MTRMLAASLSQAAPGEAACGDIVASVPRQVPDGEPAARWLVVIDGLGHGPLAAQAAEAALAVVQADAATPGADGSPWRLLRRLDGALRSTRGAAVGLAHLQAGQLRHAGVGNTRGLRWRDGQALRLASRYGIVGDGDAGSGPTDEHRPEPPESTLDLQPGDWLLLFTDGLDERLHLPAMLPAWQREPQRLCQHLMTRWRTPRDDAALWCGLVLPP